MRIFVAGASGVLGSRLVPLLVAAGHHVAGMTRTPEKAQRVRGLGAEPVVCDVFDRDALRQAVVAFGPEAVIDQLTDLPDTLAPRNDANKRMRREGTRNLIGAARTAGAHRFVCQSIAWQIEGDGGRAVEEMERQVLDVGGVVVRYGRLYGPDTYYPTEKPDPPRVHVDEAAWRTVPAISAVRSVVEITDAR